MGLRRQDNTNGKCAADLEKIIICLASNTLNKITEIMICSKSTGNALGHANETTPMVHADDTGQIIM